MTKRTAIALALLISASVLGLPPIAAAVDVNKIVESCANCHGQDGASHESDVPIIAGLSAPYLTDSLTNYASKKRPCPESEIRQGNNKGQKTDMCRVAKDLSDGDIKQLGQYFAGKKFVRAQQKFDAALAAKGKTYHEDRCEKCHSDNGASPGDDGGILAGQWMSYLEESFKEYKSGKRPMPKKMAPKFEHLDEAETAALINYYGSFK
jgi:sulfide dehydrogenase cytochrome subunit